jgi:hypothetical protein
LLPGIERAFVYSGAFDLGQRALAGRCSISHPADRERESLWGAFRIHGELLKLGLNVSERIVSRYIRRLSPPDQAGKLWAAFLRNHREAIEEVTDLLTASGMNATRISPASPWQMESQNAGSGSCRRELLDHVIVLNDVHLCRLIRDYISYYHADRIHDSLEKATPAMRPVSSKPNQSARLVSFPRIGGLHHRYDWQQAA